MKMISRPKIFIISFFSLLSSAMPQDIFVEKSGQPVLVLIKDNFINAKFSPDGNFIAITNQNYKDIYLYDIKNDDIKLLTEGFATGFGMSWAKNGKWILSKLAKFENKRRYNSIIAYNIFNSDKIVFIENETYLPGIPVWGADDGFIYMNGGDQLKLISSKDQSDERNISGFVVYAARNSIIQHNLENGNKKILFKGEGYILNLRQSPDGKKVVYEIAGGDLWVLDIETFEKTKLGIGHEPSWNPNSDKIAYMVTEDNGHVIISSEIFVINADGTGKINLTQTSDQLEMRPDWHPDGKWIIYDLDGFGPITMQKIE